MSLPATQRRGRVGGPPDDPPRRARTRRRRIPAKRWFPYVLLVPALLAELAVHVIPMLVGVWMSVQQVNQFTLRNWTRAPFIGLDNFALAARLSSPAGQQLLRSFTTTVVFTVLVVVLCWLLGLAAAVALQKPFPGRGVLRTLFLVPFALPVFTAVITWRFMLQRDTGLVNRVLVDGLGLFDDKPFWLVGPNSFVSLVVVMVWRVWPYAFLTITAGLQSIPDELYEVAEMDGAGPWQQLRRVTLPMLRPVNRVLLLVLFLWSFNDFTVPYTLFGAAAPPDADVLSVHIYQSSFVTWNFGLGSAMSVLVLAFLLVASAIYMLFSGRRAEHA
ncbi:sugar ABC transporter permease [Amycolatopsis acidiphila]|uniref:Sugar ABC transporter permease n=1 Tax=Amycolatopsis acidiphila TaxID=715473 RepID=A0A558ALT6_9PSEU|nr:sugar ABC transporter permease [Amycolatopsis acidiphila]TVT25228.1 sugar ABC transporter permease [Amycolatopsis acidiphila]UIJ62344.1 sugar ABC transporter permease [Amycolatopsis acidiphila]GHG83161.1 ABC transporter permease [Amycolatopsis acidiphila]